jgi:antitoxin ParD1/3/4
LTTMNISLPEPMREWVEAQVESGTYGNASEYFRSLVRVDQKQKAEAELEAKLLEGLNSGAATAWSKRDADTIKARLLARHKKAKTKG